MTTSRAESLGELYNHLADLTRDTLFPPGRRVQLSLACFCIVQDHHHAIALLLDTQLYASSFSLIRPLYEATVKGVWLAHCATEIELEKHAAGKELSQIGGLIVDLLDSRTPSSVSNQLAQIKRKYWKVMSSFNHAGYAQVKRWITPAGVGPVYAEAEISEIANFAAYVAVVASLERARLGKNEEAMAVISKLLPEGE